MPISGYVFESGDGILVGDHGETSYVFHSGEPVPNNGRSGFVFETGTGMGGETTQVTVTDSLGEESGDVAILSRSETVEDYYGYTEDETSATGDINNFAERDKTTFFVFQNSNTGEYSIGFVHDRLDTDISENGGDVHFDTSGFPSGGSFHVTDDPNSVNPDTDVYNYNGSITHEWGGKNTDGVVIGKFTAAELEGVSIFFEVTTYASEPSNGFGPPSTIRFAGDAGTTIDREYDGTNSIIEIQFGENFASS